MTPGRYILQGCFRRRIEWSGGERQGEDQGSLLEGKGTEAALKARKESPASLWETSTVLERRCKDELQLEGEGYQTLG